MADGAWNKGLDARKKDERQIVSEIETYTHETLIPAVSVTNLVLCQFLRICVSELGL